MTRPEDTRPADETPEGAGTTGALAAASVTDEDAADPLGPLNAVTEHDDEDDKDS